MDLLHTRHLLLRPAVPGDADFLVELMNDAQWLAQIGDRGVRTQPQAVAYLCEALVFRYDDGLGLNVAESVGTGEAIGLCGLVKRPDLPHPDLGYAFLAAQRGRGLATEAAQAVLAQAHGPLGLAHVLAITRPGNLASRRVLEKIGMRLCEAGEGPAGRCVYESRRSG